MGVDTNLINFPLHNIIFSQIYFFNDSLKNYLIIVFVTSLLLPIIFFLCLRNKFKNINKYNLILLSSLIYLFPAFQYSAIWGNNHIIALIFLTIGIFFHLRLKDCNYNSFKYYFLTVFFASLACYTRQYYVFFFLYLLLDFYLEFKIKYFLLNGIFLLILALPGLIFLLNNQVLLTAMDQEVTNFTSAILVSSSIVCFYMVPFFIQYFINLPEEGKKINKLFDIKIFLLSLFITIFCIYSFEYKGSIGGGVFYKIFFLIIKSKILFFCTSFIGIYSILFFSEKNIKNIFLSILILSTFTTGFFIFQKYFEPMFFILFLIYFDKNKILKSIEKNNFFYIIYFIGYYLIANYIYFFGL